MAQTNYTPISLYYSTTASAVPTAANLVQGELAINTADGKLYYEDSSGVVQVLATKSTGSIGGSNTQVQFNNSGSLGGSSSFTWDGTTVTATKFAGALNGTVGATTASTGAFTTLTSNGATTFTAGTASTSTTTGTAVITGGLGVSGRVNAANFDGIVGANTAAAGSFTTINASTSITNAGLTSGRVTYAGASGLLSDSANFVFDGTNVGIGTNSPTAKLDITSASAGFSNIKLVQTGVRTWAIENTGTSGLFKIIEAGVADRLVIDSSGNVGIGTSSPALGGARAYSKVLTIDGGVSASTENTGALELGGSTDVNNRLTGSLAFFNRDNTGSTGATRQQVGLIETICVTSNSNVNNDSGGTLVFLTKAEAGFVTEKMRIDSAGIVTMSAYGAGAATFSAAGVISSVSDENWKTKDGVPTNTDAMLQKLEPGYWFYNEEKAPIYGQDRQLGFYAQNVHEAIGEEAAPTPEKYKDEKGNDTDVSKPWGYYDRSVLAVAVMSLKNALTTIEELKQRITALENK